MRSYPGSVPVSIGDLERAIVLLGNRSRGPLRLSRETELKGLVASYPTMEEAKIWKSYLKNVLKSMKS